jgi:ParB-like chromosome segregation protein Spo0J
MTDLVEISKIKVGERRRDGYGDVAKLAESIREEGLLHPIGVTEDMRLIYGARRLRAVKQLGRKHIEARIYGNLEDLELRRKELAENVQRLDLTQEERDKNLLEAVEITREILREEDKDGADGETRDISTQVSRSGPAPQPDSTRSVAKRLGVGEKRIRDARARTEKRRRLEAKGEGSSEKLKEQENAKEAEKEEVLKIQVLRWVRLPAAYSPKCLEWMFSEVRIRHPAQHRSDQGLLDRGTAP